MRMKEKRMLNLLALVWSGQAMAVEVTWSGGGHASNPQFSPDGTWLAFEVNNNSDKVDLYLVRLNAGNPTQPATRIVIPGGGSSFSAAGSYTANPTWIPGGGLFFEAANPGGQTRIYYVTPGGAAPVEYLSSSVAPGMLAWPAVSPDGTKVAFTSGASGGGDIYLHDRSSNKVGAAFRTENSENAPRICSDNSTMVFTRKNYGSEDIFTWKIGSTETAPLNGATGNGDQTRPFCTGGKVVFFTNARGDEHWDIAVVPQTGGTATTLAKDVRLPLRATPSLTPDGLSLLYTSSIPASDNLIYITRLDGSGTKTINTGLSAVGEPDIVVVNGRSYLTFTALPAAGADWRQLHVIDITGQY
jgi:Tol biopolymer transport system component